MTTNTDEIEKLFRQHYAALLRIATVLVQDDEMARDIVHDVFASLVTAPASTATAVYLARAVRNRCFNQLRDISVRERFRNLYLLENDEADDEEAWPDEETLRLVADAIGSIPSEQCRRVVDMRYAQGMKYKEIADAAGISETAVYKHLRHALEVIRQTLGKNG